MERNGKEREEEEIGRNMKRRRSMEIKLKKMDKNVVRSTGKRGEDNEIKSKRVSRIDCSGGKKKELKSRNKTEQGTKKLVD